MLTDIKNLTEEQREFECGGMLYIYRSGIKIPADTKISGTVFKKDSLYIVEGKVDAVLKLKCDLCLSTVTKNMQFDFNEAFSEERPDDDDCGEVWLMSDEDVKSKSINIDNALCAALLYNLPMRILCSDECKGLCPKCGHNLNEGDCGCDRTYRNPQFEMLLDLFKDEDGGD